jgi:hypothetical protein
MAHQYTEEDARKMGEIADAAVADAMTELAGLLSDQAFRDKLLDHDNLASDFDFECQLDVAMSHLHFLLEVVGSRQERLCPPRGDKVEAKGSA